YILTNEHASPRPLLAWFAIVVGSALYGVGPAQSFWNGLTGLEGIIGFVTFLLVWMAALIGFYYAARRVRRPPPAARLNPAAS
ncbi:MAG: hypothetical protein B6D41_16130, partial [Chloroflexi bacterium UTCFX4]